MADVEEIEIKLKVDDSEVKKALDDNTPVSEKSMGTGSKTSQAGAMGGGIAGGGVGKGLCQVGALFPPLPFFLLGLFTVLLLLLRPPLRLPILLPLPDASW